MQQKDQARSYLAQLIEETSPGASARETETRPGSVSEAGKPNASLNKRSTSQPEEDWNVDTVRVPRLRRARLQSMPTVERPVSSTIETANARSDQVRTPLSPIGLGHLDDLSDLPTIDDDETLHAIETVRRIHQRYMLQAQGQLKVGKARDRASGRPVGSNQASAAHLMQLSGMMRAVRLPEGAGETAAEADGRATEVEEFWPEGIKQTGPLPVSNLYGKEPFGRTLPGIPAVSPVVPVRNLAAGSAVATPAQSWWRKALGTPAVKVGLGLVIGIALLVLVARYVDIPTTISILHARLTTPQGILFALLAGVAFLLAFCIRGTRWKLFLNPVGQVSTMKAIQLFLVGTFLNFLLPIRGGEVAKSLMLKRIADIPVSQSLPTVAMDKALDLMPALIIMAIVPFLGVKMDIRLWLVLGTVGALLVCLIFFIALAAWKRDAAITLLHRMMGVLPKSIGRRVEGFATGFVDALLAGASQPRIFIPAVLLTIVAVMFDGLYAMLAFWTVGVPISFGMAIFGYAVFNMFYILPNPPGQVGSNEFFGLLVFSGLLHLDAKGVTAMFIFSHPWAAVIQTVVGMACLSALGLTVSSAMKVQNEA